MIEPPIPEPAAPAPAPASAPATTPEPDPASISSASGAAPITSPNAPTPALSPATPASPASATRPSVKSPKPVAGELIPTAMVVCFIALLFGFLGYFAYKNLTKAPKVEKVWPLAERAKRDFRLIPLQEVLHAEKVTPLPPAEDSKYLEEAWVENPPNLPEDVIFGRDGRRRHAITYTWAPEKIATGEGEKETIPSLTEDWSFGAVFRDPAGRTWPGFPLISKYAYEGDLEIDTTINLPSHAKLWELYAHYIYDGEQTGLKVLFFVLETTLYEQQQGKPVETRVHAQLYLLRYNRYYALTEPAPTTIKAFEDFTLQFRCIDHDIDLKINGDKVLKARFPDQWPEDESYIGGVPGTTFADGRKPHHAGFLQFKALDFGDQKGKGYIKELTIKGTPVHIKINTMRERVWWTKYRPLYLQQQEESGSAEVTPLIPDPGATSLTK